MLGLNPEVLRFHQNVTWEGTCQRTLYVFLVIYKNPDFWTKISATSGKYISLKFGKFVKPIKSKLL